MKTSGFKWTSKRSKAVVLLSTGHTIEETALKVDVSEKSIYNWKNNEEFITEIDRLSLMTDIASRAERLRIAKRIVRNKGIESKRDLLEWLKYAQSETDGVRLDLAALAEAAASLAGDGSDRFEPSESTEDTQDQEVA